MIFGRFHLGFKYDINLWTSNRTCGVFNCQEEKDGNNIAGRGSGTLKKGLVDMLIVITESMFLIMEPDHKIKNVARLVAWATLASLE